MFWFWIILAFMAGGTFGCAMMAMIAAGSKADAHMRWDGKDGEG